MTGLGGAVAALLIAAAPVPVQLRAEIIDGDTLRVGGRVVRMAGIDAPELRARCPAEARAARAARDRLAALAARGVRVEPVNGRDRYGRLLARVTDRQGRDLGALLLAERHAVPYLGRGPRHDWCRP